jgi:hypothetical protein
MRKIDAARLKKELTGAAGKRLQLASIAQNAAPVRLRNRDSRKAIARLLGSEVPELAKARKGFATILAADAAQSAMRVKKANAEAQRNVRASRPGLKRAIAERIKAMKTLAAQPAVAGSAQYYFLDKPFLIWPTLGLQMDDAAYVSANSWAKAHATASDVNSFVGLRFYYLWTNPHDAYSVINIGGFLILNGTCQASAGGGFWPSDRYSKLSLDAKLEIYEWWNQPPTSPVPQMDQSINVVTLEANQEGFSEVGDIEFKSIFRAYGLSYSLMLVPPLATVVFAFNASFSSTNGTDSSQTIVDFATGNFQIGCPYGLVTLLS